MTMKRTAKITLLVISLAGLCLLQPASLPPFARGQNALTTQAQSHLERNSCCDRLTDTARGTATGPNTIVTTVDVTLSGQLFGGAIGLRSFTATSTATLLMQSVAADGTISGISSHVFEMNGYSNGNGQCEPGELCFTTL